MRTTRQDYREMYAGCVKVCAIANSSDGSVYKTEFHPEIADRPFLVLRWDESGYWQECTRAAYEKTAVKKMRQMAL